MTNVTCLNREYIEWLKEKIKEKGISIEKLDINELISLAQQREIIIKTDCLDRIRQDILAKIHGYEDINEYNKEKCWNRGDKSPMSENDECSSNFGVYKGEKLYSRYLLTKFDNVRKTFYNNDGGIDFICKDAKQEFIDQYHQFNLENNKEYTIQLKLRCLTIGWNTTPRWIFGSINPNYISYNKIPDFYLLSAWYNRDDFAYTWLIHKDERIRGREKLWNKVSVSITNSPKNIIKFKKYNLDMEMMKCMLKEISI